MYVTEGGIVTNSVALGYVSMSEKANIKLVELVGKHSISMSEGKGPSCKRRDKINLVWKELMNPRTDFFPRICCNLV
jgi:hypothetical protein